MIKDLSCERNCLASLFRHKALLSDILMFVKESDFFSRLHRAIYGAILMAFQKDEDISPFSIANKISNSGISTNELDGSLSDMLEELSLIQVNEKAGMESFRELKKVSVRREIWGVGANLQKEMEGARDKDIEQIISLADAAYSSKIHTFETGLNNDFVDIYENIEEIIEDRGNNPITEFGFMGPLNRVNDLYGSLLRDGNITLIGARSGVGKTQFSMFYLNHCAAKYSVPLIHADAGESSELELQIRAVSMLSEGKVPMYLLETGQWRKNPEMTKAVRAVWPIVKKIKYHYIDTSDLKPDEILSSIYRFYLSKVGRGNKFLTNYDYLKSFDGYDSNEKEWQTMGYFIQKVKAFIKNKTQSNFWTSLQLNRSGVTAGKSGAQLVPTEENFSISDRIIWQASHAFILRNKTTDELAAEPGLGNMKLYNVGKRRFLGKDAQLALNPVTMPDGSFQPNHIMLESNNFFFREIGALSDVAANLGQLNHHHNHHNAGAAQKRQKESDEADLIA